LGKNKGIFGFLFVLISGAVWAAAEQTEHRPIGFSDSWIMEQSLRFDPAALVNGQGWARQDLSIRGSSYSGSGISINGLNIKNPYSRHWHSEIPIVGNLFAKPKIKTGLDNVSGHLVGTAEYTTTLPETRVQASTGIGSGDHFTAAFFGQIEGAGGFLNWEKAGGVDFEANDFDRIAAGLFARHLCDDSDWIIDLLAGYQRKDFGAQGYYGIPSTVYADERAEDALVFLSAISGSLDDAYFRVSGSWRQFDDDYRIPAAGFSSDVRSRFAAVAVEGRTMEIQNIALNFRADIENGQVDGDIDRHDRLRGSVLILPQATFKHFRFTAGLNNVFQTSESAEWLPQAGIEWFVTDNSTLYVSYSENVEQPDYQVLYCNDPYHAGSGWLDPQRARNTEIGFRQVVSAGLDWRAAAFRRRVENASDWVKKTASDTIWKATDLGKLDVMGVETEMNYYPSNKLDLRVRYQWITKDDYDYYAGLYELDYPKHLLAFSGHWKPLKEWTFFAAQTLRWQTVNEARRSGDFGAEASVGVHYFPSWLHHVRLTLTLDNLWGAGFQSVPGLKPPERTVFAGLTAAW